MLRKHLKKHVKEQSVESSFHPLKWYSNCINISTYLICIISQYRYFCHFLFSICNLIQGQTVHAICDKHIYSGYSSLKCNTQNLYKNGEIQLGTPLWHMNWNMSGCVRKDIIQEKYQVTIICSNSHLVEIYSSLIPVFHCACKNVLSVYFRWRGCLPDTWRLMVIPTGFGMFFASFPRLWRVDWEKKNGILS